jgi:hypothetical protein
MLFACTRSYPLGRLSVRVIDASGAPVGLVAADLFKMGPSGKVYWRASRTDGGGVAVFGAKDGGVIEGDYLVHIGLMPWQKLAPGETNDRPVRLKKGDDIVLTFRLVPRLPVRPKLQTGA